MDRTGGRRIIERPRLLRLLNETDARIILLLAPAGYGKTTLAHQWLNQQGRRGVTYRPTSRASDTAGLAAAISAKASEFASDTGEGLRRRLRLRSAPSVEAIAMAELLAEDLRLWPPDAWLTIEDFHLFSDPDVNAFMETLVDSIPIRLLLTSRIRPPWITARRRLYEEVVVIGREDLTFTEKETQALLDQSDAATVVPLLALSGGWPAVIGLAAHFADPLPTLTKLPAALYDYLADELYQHSPPFLRSALHDLATANEIDLRLVEHLHGSSAEAIISGATEAGFIHHLGDGSFELHPLLRAFLLRKAEQTGGSSPRSSALQVTDYYFRTRAWDSAFETIERFSLRDQLNRLLEEGLEDCLAEGRLTTLSKWLDLAQAWNISSPARDRAEGEHAFRQGDYEYAGSRLESAIDHLPSGSARLAQASYRLGQAKQFLSRADEAIAAYRVAEAHAPTIDDRRAALWGLFTLACETTGQDLDKYLRSFRDSGPLGADDALRLATGSVAVEIRRGRVDRALRAIDRSVPGLSRAKDPMIRTSFLNSATNALLLAGKYNEALAATAVQIREAKQFRLSFVLPHAYLNRASALAAMRRTAEAKRAAATAQRHFGVGSDTFAETNLAVVTMKLAILDSDLEKARIPLESCFKSPTGTTLDAEIAALLALLTSAASEFADAHSWIDIARGLPGTFDTTLTVAWASAICALGSNGNSVPALALYRQSISTGHIEPFVWAYRAFPALLTAILDSGTIDLAGMTRILRLTRDLAMINRTKQREVSGLASLSPRELEVASLLARGLSNRELAEALGITEVTAKAHVHHILEKLGARSRTQAALLFASSLTMRELRLPPTHTGRTASEH